ncbi:DNA-directed RNA polymerase III subunit RPC6, partial [Geodia barretti]
TSPLSLPPSSSPSPLSLSPSLKSFKAQSSNSDPLSKKSASYASPQEVCKFITELGISRVALTPENIETILNTLVYDGKAESSVVMGGGGGREVAATTVFRLSRPLVSDTGLSRIPCGVCPISALC